MTSFEFLGPYRIGEVIGRGGMGTVYRGVHEKTGQPVAVKLLSAHVADDPRFRRRFASEVETLKRLKHRNIVTLIGYGEQAGQLFYSMELVNGESLQQLLRREKRLAWPLVLEMAIEICAALKHAHDFGVIHRDLKPSNLLIDRDRAVQLVDFGIAKLFGSHDQTAAGSVLGTADYMAPEQAGEGVITPRTDLYSLGNVLYACFAGRPPFAGRTLTQVVESLRQEPPVRIDVIVPDLPPEIAELIHDLLEKRPEDRPPTALAVMNRIKAIRAGLNHLATRLHDDAETMGAVSPASPQAMGEGLDPPTAASAGDNKTLGQFDDGKVTASPPPPSDQLTIDATFPSEPAVATVKGESAAGVGAAADAAVDTTTRTHFRTVEDQALERDSSSWGPDRHEQEGYGSLWHWLSVATLVAALLAGLAIFVWAMQSPRPDELYQAILQAQQDADDRAARDEIDKFLRLYPEDPRRDELVDVREQLQASQTVQRLREAASAGGADQLTAEAEAFWEAIKGRDPLRARARLRHWLAIYAPQGEPVDPQGEPVDPQGEPVRKRSLRTVSLQMLVKAAQLELEKPGSLPLLAPDDRAEQLLRRIQWGQENLSAEDQRELLEGILTLFSDKPWAKSVLEEAERRLAETQR